MFSQKESVFQAVISIVTVDSGTTVDLNKEQRASVIQAVTASILSGDTEFSAEARAKYVGEAQIKGYVNGMVSNWLRKDTRLNGGSKYETKNPGSRAGQGDEVLKNLKNLKAQTNDPDQIELIDSHIANRTAEIAATKTKKTTAAVNYDALPADLRAKLGL